MELTASSRGPRNQKRLIQSEVGGKHLLARRSFDPIDGHTYFHPHTHTHTRPVLDTQLPGGGAPDGRSAVALLFLSPPPQPRCVCLLQPLRAERRWQVLTEFHLKGFYHSRTQLLGPLLNQRRRHKVKKKQ